MTVLLKQGALKQSGDVSVRVFIRANWKAEVLIQLRCLDVKWDLSVFFTGKIMTSDGRRCGWVFWKENLLIRFSIMPLCSSWQPAGWDGTEAGCAEHGASDIVTCLKFASAGCSVRQIR